MIKLSTKEIFLFSLVLLLGLSNCENQYEPGKRNTNAVEHNYTEQNDTSPSTTNGSSTEDHLATNTDIRDIWQRPELVLKQLGELDGKVVADIGAGPYGYFSLRIAQETNAKKVIAIDIDQEALNIIADARKAFLPENAQDRLETRLVTASDPKLEPGEADIVLIVNTTIYIENRLQYLKNLRKGIRKGGKLIIIDYKKKSTPIGPPVNLRIALGEMERELVQAGYTLLPSDDKLLDFQYIIKATVE